MLDAYIYDAVRTPRGRGRASGGLHRARPIDLLVTVLAALRDRSALDTAHVDDVIVGCVTQTGEQGACIARFAALEAGYAHRVPGVTLNRFCASGLEAVNLAAALVSAGAGRLIVAGGVESMSRVPMGSDGGVFQDPGMLAKVAFVPQGISADLVATLHDIAREELDAFALASQRRAAAARAAGAFARSLVPVCDATGRPYLDADEHPRPETTAESLAKLPPAFEALARELGAEALVRREYPQVERLRHVHTAGSSSGIVDGAAAVLVGSRAAGEALGLRPRARIRAFAVTGDEPLVMLTGPLPATRMALARAGLAVRDLDLVEVNEAFAVVPILCQRELGLDPARLNVNGGAIALGHPLGATGAMLVGTLLDELEARGLGTGLVTLCAGGGMGIATVIERT